MRKIVNVLYVGKLSYNKGTDILNSVAGMLPPHIKINVIGYGDYQLHGKIRYLGKKDRGEVANIMRKSDILIHPARMEGLCRVIQEAQATGLPVIAAKVGGNSELVDDLHNGLLLDLSVDQFYRAVVLLANDKGLREKLGFWSYVKSRRYNWDNTVDRYQYVLRMMV